MKNVTRRRTPPSLLRNRPNKTAKGMSATSRRSGHDPGGGDPRSEHNRDVLSLNVNGTTDRYHPLMFRTERGNKRGSCPCCGRPQDKLICLNDKGRTWLKSKRSRRLRKEKRT